MADKLTAILVGCGGISATWLKAAKEIDDLEIVGLVDLNEDAAKSRREEFELSGAITGTDLSSALANLKPDVAFDCTIPEAHLETTLTALRGGCHVLGEKPMADSLDNARRMIEAAREAGKTYAVIQNRRYDPNIRAYRALTESGTLGSLTTLSSDFYIGAHFGGFRDRMKHALLLDMAIHTFDAARLISGADPVAVYCKEWNPSGSWYDHDASAIAIFEMTGGIIYTYRGSWCAEGLNTTWECDWRAICERGSATWDGATGFKAQRVAKTGGFFSEWEDVSVVSGRDSEIPAEEQHRVGGHAGLIREFLDCIRAGATPETVCTDNIKSLAMVFAAIESAEAGKRVEIKA
jgi:predicted dehydrogenase